MKNNPNKIKESIRLNPPIWRHDAYTLRCMASSITNTINTLLPEIKKSRSSEIELTIIDMGAGDMPYRPLFDRHGARYIACDIDVTEDDGVICIQPGSKVALSDNSADIITSFQVLEHVWDIDWYLGESARLLKDDGFLMLSTHGTWLYHPHPTDYRRWTCDGLVAEIQSRGFEICSFVPLVGPLAWTTQFRTLGYHSVLSKIPVIGASLSGLLCTAMYMRMWIEDAITPKKLHSTNASTYLLLAKKIPYDKKIMGCSRLDSILDTKSAI